MATVFEYDEPSDTLEVTFVPDVTSTEIKLNDRRTLAGCGTFIHGNFREWEPQARHTDGELKMR